ncbi:MAG: AAA family ATPase [Bacteroidota bacterium]
MILSYIWVEDYKGFRNEGFNFNSKYTFDFDSYDSILTKKNNEKHISNFFGENISDVVGIVGKNSSGKTNILELIQYVVDGANTIINKPFFVLFTEDDKFKIYQFRIENIHPNFNAQVLPYDGRIKNLNSIFISNIFDGRSHNFNKSIINISTNELLNPKFGENTLSNYQKTLQNQLKFLNSRVFKSFQSVQAEVAGGTFLFDPNQVTVTTPTWTSIEKKAKKFEVKYKEQTNHQLELQSFVRMIRKKITANKSINSFKYYMAFIVMMDFILNEDALNKYDYSSNEEYQLLKELDDFLGKQANIEEIFNYITTVFATKINDNWPVFETHKFLIDLREFDNKIFDNDFSRIDVGAYSNKKIQFSFNFNQKISRFLSNYLEAVTNKNITLNVNWEGISSGHKAFLSLFSNIYSIKNRVRSENVILTIDEGDLYFHPKWQSEFIWKLVNVLPYLIKANIQIVLTSHSPFVVSDLPKSNLIFVEKEDYLDMPKLRVIPQEEIEGNTFGGNIGELYLDAFFMQGSLISKFAADKIKSIVNKINNTNFQLNDEDRIVISQIGDQLIKKQLENISNDTI